MKKKYYIIIILFILGALIVLANIKLPVSFITKEKINEISNNQINLTSFDKQYFKLLPAPYIILTDPILDINIKNLTARLNIDKIEINRSLLDQKNYAILIGGSINFYELLDTFNKLIFLLTGLVFYSVIIGKYANKITAIIFLVLYVVYILMLYI